MFCSVEYFRVFKCLEMTKLFSNNVSKQSVTLPVVVVYGKRMIKLFFIFHLSFNKRRQIFS